MIFAAGMGTRLKPYTESMPKALVPLAGTPMIEILINHLRRNGITNIIINVHHFANQVIDFIAFNQNFGCNITISLEEDILLDTGGGLKKAAWFFDDKKPFLVQNVDVLSDLNYNEMIDFHEKSNALISLAVTKRASSRYFLFNKQMQLCGWENTKTGEKRIIQSGSNKLERYAFSGIHVIDPAIFNLITKDGKFSIIDTYLEIAATHMIRGFEHSPENWVDMGKPDDLLKAEKLIAGFKYL